jgi:hypothetical protein
MNHVIKQLAGVQGPGTPRLSPTRQGSVTTAHRAWVPWFPRDFGG